MDEWEKYELHHRARLAIKPGLTGMWQVSGRSEITDFEEVVKLDTKYISEWSFMLDIKILFKTVLIVLGQKGSIEKVIKLWYNRKQKFMKNERRKYMNNSKQDILNNLIKEPFINQRILAAQTGHSLGIVNRSIKELISEGYLDEEIRPTEKTLREAKEKAPKNAIILAAGFGMRMVPINTETPKGLLEIKGERLIERTIRQLHEVGITEIYVVVGFMKEQYE